MRAAGLEVTGRFSKLVYQFPIRIPERPLSNREKRRGRGLDGRFSLVIRSLLMQEGICMCLNPDFSIIEAPLELDFRLCGGQVALPYASKRLLSDPNPTLRPFFSSPFSW